MCDHSKGMDSAKSRGNDEEEEIWLNNMRLFCTELQSFLAAEVPDDANLQDYAAGSSHVRLLLDKQKDKYPTLHKEEFAESKTDYMYGIVGCKQDVKEVHRLGMQACNMVNKHHAFGVFQGDPETRVELFFERQLNICMALGVEHC